MFQHYALSSYALTCALLRLEETCDGQVSAQPGDKCAGGRLPQPRRQLRRPPPDSEGPQLPYVLPYVFLSVLTLTQIPNMLQHFEYGF